MAAPNAAATRGIPTQPAAAVAPNKLERPWKAALLGSDVGSAVATLVVSDARMVPVSGAVPTLELAGCWLLDRVAYTEAAPSEAKSDREASVSASLVGAAVACEDAGGVMGPYWEAVW